MKITPNVHDYYFMSQTFNIKGNLVKEGSFDNNKFLSDYGVLKKQIILTS